MARSDRMEPSDIGCDSWYHAYWRERHRAQDLRSARDGWLRRALRAEKEVAAHDCVTQFAFTYPGGMHELVIVASVYLWGAVQDMGFVLRAIPPERFAFLAFRSLWSVFRQCGTDPALWVRLVWMRDDPITERLEQCATEPLPELLHTVREYLEIRRLTDRLMELT